MSLSITASLTFFNSNVTAGTSISICTIGTAKIAFEINLFRSIWRNSFLNRYSIVLIILFCLLPFVFYLLFKGLRRAVCDLHLFTPSLLLLFNLFEPYLKVSDTEAYKNQGHHCQNKCLSPDIHEACSLYHYV